MSPYFIGVLARGCFEVLNGTKVAQVISDLQWILRILRGGQRAEQYSREVTRGGDGGVMIGNTGHFQEVNDEVD